MNIKKAIKHSDNGLFIINAETAEVLEDIVNGELLVVDSVFYDKLRDVAQRVLVELPGADGYVPSQSWASSMRLLLSETRHLLEMNAMLEATDEHG